ncbi:hypothetical protein ACFL3L_02790 [Candidatus Neomarinimicrobiota bacterium]
MNLSNLVRAALFASVAIGLGFSLVMVPNIELITVVVFLAGLTLGAGWGILVGGTAEFIFSALNPLGSGLLFLPLFIAQVSSMAIIGALGGLMRPIFFKEKYGTLKIVGLIITGFFLTLFFDSITTLSFPISAGYDWPQTWGLYLSGIGFTILHQISNAIVFSIGVPLVTKHLA